MKGPLVLSSITVASLAAAAPPIPPPSNGPGPHSYSVQFSAVRIRQLRSQSKDTVYASMAVAVNGVTKQTAAWDGRGGRNNNKGFLAFLQQDNALVLVNTGAINDSDVVKVSYVVANIGHSSDHTVKDLNSTVGSISTGACEAAALSSAGIVTIPVAGTACAVSKAVSFITQNVAGLFSTNCDGVVDAQSFTLKRSDLVKEADVPGRAFMLEGPQVTQTSPRGCGHSSNYQAYFRISED
jgi:hypothetical protein